jgi:hypothetical protein
MREHSVALVPIETWCYQSPILKHAGRPLDMGLFAEALLYYDHVLVVPANEPGFAAFVQWFTERNLFEELLALLKDGTVGIYYYAFSTAPVFREGVYSLLHIQDEQSAREPIFFSRVLGHRSLTDVLTKGRHRERLAKALGGRVIEVKADTFGPAIENARADFENQQRWALVMQSLLDDVGVLLKGRVPEIVTSVVEPGTSGARVTWNVDFEAVREALGPQLGFHRGTPLAGLAIANKLLWSASQEHCDLYLPSPVSSLVGDKLAETDARATKPQAVIDQLIHEVEFPDVRLLVNDEKLELKDVLDLRKRSQKFRNWLQDERQRDRNAILAYHHEVARDSGLVQAARETLRIFGVLGSISAAAAVPSSAGLLGAIGVGVGAEGLRFLTELIAQRNEGWKPVVFGDWARDRIDRIVASGREMKD